MEREEYMRAALTLAHAAAADGEVPVGCVIVDAGGRIIGRGRNRRERTHRADAHAEMEAIAEACRARGTPRQWPPSRRGHRRGACARGGCGHGR